MNAPHMLRRVRINITLSRMRPTLGQPAKRPLMSQNHFATTLPNVERSSSCRSTVVSASEECDLIWLFSNEACLVSPLVSDMIIPVRCFTCGKVRFRGGKRIQSAVSAFMSGRAHQSVALMKPDALPATRSTSSLAGLVHMHSQLFPAGCRQQMGGIHWPCCNGLFGDRSVGHA